jgi:hypothetical protein
MGSELAGDLVQLSHIPRESGVIPYDHTRRVAQCGQITKQASQFDLLFQPRWSAKVDVFPHDGEAVFGSDTLTRFTLK